MKNIQVIDGALNCAYDVYQATDEEFKVIFPSDGQDIAFADEIHQSPETDIVFNNLWSRLIKKQNIIGIHGTLFYELEHKKQYYPNRKEDDLTNGLGRSS